MKKLKVTNLFPKEEKETWDIFAGKIESKIFRVPKLGKLINLVFATFILIFSVIPVFWVVIAAFDASNTLINQSLFPRIPSFENFALLLSNSEVPFLHWMYNSLIISLTTTCIVAILSAFSAYSFSRFRYRGKRSFSILLLVFQLFPNILAIVGLYLLLDSIGAIIPFLGLDTYGGLIMIYSSGATGFNMWIMKGYFDTIPIELDEAAKIDGASNIQIFLRIFLPLARPVIVTVAMLTFIATYGDFFLPRVLLTTPENFTLAIGLSKLVVGQYTTAWGIFAAGALLSCIPVLAIFSMFQKQITSGATLGAVKF